ncbi:MAG: hypothetical protein M1834_009593 [Cirrosporium novae-zelandiae]|nr:MAG: hypothetical protein M1834_009593 [Cirrosporium novae-zelandiae]
MLDGGERHHANFKSQPGRENSEETGGHKDCETAVLHKQPDGIELAETGRAAGGNQTGREVPFSHFCNNGRSSKKDAGELQMHEQNPTRPLCHSNFPALKMFAPPYHI